MVDCGSALEGVGIGIGFWQANDFDVGTITGLNAGTEGGPGDGTIVSISSWSWPGQLLLSQNVIVSMSLHMQRLYLAYKFIMLNCNSGALVSLAFSINVVMYGSFKQYFV